MQVKFLRESSEEGELFEQLLLDEPEGHAGSSNGAPAFGLMQFLQHIHSEVDTQLHIEADAVASAAAATAAKR